MVALALIYILYYTAGNQLEVPGDPIHNTSIENMNDTTQQILELYIEECKIKGKLLTIEEFSEDIDNTIGWDEFQFQLVFPPIRIHNNCMMNNKKVKVGDIVNVKGEEWAMYVVGVEGDKVSYVELDMIDYCDVSDIEA